MCVKCCARHRAGDEFESRCRARGSKRISPPLIAALSDAAISRCGPSRLDRVAFFAEVDAAAKLRQVPEISPPETSGSSVVSQYASAALAIYSQRRVSDNTAGGDDQPDTAAQDGDDLAYTDRAGRTRWVVLSLRG